MIKIIYKRSLLFVLVFAVLVSVFAYSGALIAQAAEPFADVPGDNWAYSDINQLRELGITNGVGNNLFGLGRNISRADFVTFLVRLMGWEIVEPSHGSFTDNTDRSQYYYGSVETAFQHGIVKGNRGLFRPHDPITREEITLMIVRTVGYETLANQLDADKLESPFSDVTRNIGAITVGKDIGLINGKGHNNFDPYSYARREEAAAMMMRMYNKLSSSMEELHAFYAISSASQIDKFSELDSVSFGWARLEFNEGTGQVEVNTDGNDNEYYIPTGYSEVIEKAANSNASRQLMFAVRDQNITDPKTGKTVKLAEYIVTDPDAREQAVNAMAAMVNHTEKYGYETVFDGLVSDFEGFKGNDLKRAYNTFLTELNAELDKTGKKLYVAVHPEWKPGQEYFDGYDYKTIGEIADKVILMAHDYEATSLTDAEMKAGYTDTPLTPFDEIYFALKGITDPVTGVQDRNKIWLQLSMDTVQWQLKDGKVINKFAYHPSYEQLMERFKKPGVSLNYSELSQNPYATFTDENGNKNVIWYENQRSVDEKIRLAKMFGISGLSVWRLGTIPEFEDTAGTDYQLNIWQEIVSNY